MFHVIKHSHSEVRPILSLNSKQLHKKFYPNNLNIVDTTYNFL